MITHLEPDILKCEVKWALESITVDKASGSDGIPVELFQILKDDAVKVLHSVCQHIWKTQLWPQDWKRSIFITIPKKGNAKKCSNYHTIALISHANKVCSKSFKIVFRTWIKNYHMYICFTDYTKFFDCMDDNKLWKILQEMGMPDHLTCLLRNLYAGQEATVKTCLGTTDWFQIGKGICQDCVLSPCLFNLFVRYIMQNARLD